MIISTPELSVMPIPALYCIVIAHSEPLHVAISKFPLLESLYAILGLSRLSNAIEV